MHTWTRLIRKKKISCDEEFRSRGVGAVKWEDVTRTRGQNVLTMMIVLKSCWYFFFQCLPNKSIFGRLLDNRGYQPVSDGVQFIFLEPVDHINGAKPLFWQSASARQELNQSRDDVVVILSSNEKCSFFLWILITAHVESDTCLRASYSTTQWERQPIHFRALILQLQDVALDDTVQAYLGKLEHHQLNIFFVTYFRKWNQYIL